MAIQIEIERKFLVKFPSSWIQLSELFDNLIDIKRISQSYLMPEKGEQAARVRKTIEGLTGDKTVKYHYNKKTPIPSGGHKEEEYEISAADYNKKLKQSNPDKREVNKTRFVFKYNDQVFELDVFKGPLKGLAILEIELKTKNQKVELPPYLKVIKEVTEEKKFNNFNLANVR